MTPEEILRARQSLGEHAANEMVKISKAQLNSLREEVEENIKGAEKDNLVHEARMADINRRQAESLTRNQKRMEEQREEHHEEIRASLHDHRRFMGDFHQLEQRRNRNVLKNIGIAVGTVVLAFIMGGVAIRATDDSDSDDE